MPKAPPYWHVQGCDNQGKWGILSQSFQTEVEAQDFANQALCPTDEVPKPPTVVWIVNPYGEVYRWTSQGSDLIEFAFAGYAIHWHRKPL